MRAPRFDALVVGGGLVGLCCALALQERGLAVVLLDPGDPRARASYGNAGVVSPGSILPVAGPGVRRALLRYALGRDPGLRLRWRALPGMGSWLSRFLAACDEVAVERAAAALAPLTARAPEAHAALADRVGARPLLSRRGWLRLYRSPEAFAAAAPERALLARHGVASEVLSGREVREAEPALAPRFARGLLLPEAGAVEDPGELVRLCEAAFRERGGVVTRAAVSRLAQERDEAVAAFPGGEARAGCGVLAAGARSAALARGLGLEVPLAAERGYHLHLAPGDGGGPTRPVADVEGGYVLAPMRRTVRLLSGIELARPDDPPDERQLRLVLADARRTLPLAAIPGEAAWHGSRPSTPDGLPVIGTAPGAPRILLAFGHGHIGFSTAPVTGALVADLATGRAPAIPVEPYAPGRFRRGAPA